MSRLVNPHGGGELKPLLLSGKEREEELTRARSLPVIPMTSRETSDLIMLGIGAFTPLTGFMTHGDWEGVCDGMKMASGMFWPIPITLSTDTDTAEGIRAKTEDACRIDRVLNPRVVSRIGRIGRGRDDTFAEEDL